MANQLYAKAKEGFLTGTINLSTDTLKCALVRATAYTPNIATDQYYSSISAVVGTPQTLANKALATGNNYVTFDADDVTFATVAAGAAIDYVVIYKDTGNAATSPLIYLADTMTGLPVTPGGGDITIRWDSGANKIFKWNG